MQGKLVQPGLTIGKEYSVSFKLFPTAFSPGWHNVLHFTTGVDHGKPGSRIPVVFLHMTEGNTRIISLWICSDVNENINSCWHKKSMHTHTWTSIQIKQTSASLSYTYQVLIDGEVKHEVINKSPRVFRNVKLYVSNPWYPAQEGLIKDLEYSGGLFCLIHRLIRYQLCIILFLFYRLCAPFKLSFCFI